MSIHSKTSNLKSPGRNERSRNHSTASATMWLVLLLSFSLLLSACGTSSNSEPIIEIPPTDVPATMVPATEELAEDTPESPLSASESSMPASPLSAPESPMPASSAFESPLIIRGAAQAGFGGLGGRILNTDLSGVQSSYANGPIRLATVVLEPQTNEKLFILSGAESPGISADEEGYFLFDALDPGEYVMMVGDVIGYHEIVLAPDGQAQIYVVESDKVLNAGVIEVELP